MKVLLIVKLVGCGGCELFNRTHREELLDELRDEPGLKVVEILYGTSDKGGMAATDPYTKDKLSLDLSQSVREQIRWFPTFLLVSEDELEGDGPASVSVYNSRVVNGTLEPASSPLTASRISLWVSEHKDPAGMSSSTESARSGYFCNSRLCRERRMKISETV